MYKILGFFIGVIIVCNAVAQIPNNSFESWTDMGSYDQPDDWSTLNALTDLLGIYTCEKGTPGNPGSAYLKLTSKNVTGMGVIPGIAVSGIIDPLTYSALSGFAYAGRPEKLTGMWQHMIFGSSQGFIDVQLTQWDAINNQRVIIGSGHKPLTGMAMSWAAFTVNITYESDLYPDSCIITFSASGDTPAQNDFLYIDDLQFEGDDIPSAISNYSASGDIAIFPNPTNDNFILNFPQNIEFGNLEIVNSNGQEIAPLSSNLVEKGKLSVNVGVIPQGIYFVSIISDKIRYTTQLVVL